MKPFKKTYAPPPQGTLPKGVLPRGHHKKKSRSSNKSTDNNTTKEEVTIKTDQIIDKKQVVNDKPSDKSQTAIGFSILENGQEAIDLLNAVMSSNLRPNSHVNILSKKINTDTGEASIRRKKLPTDHPCREGSDTSIPLTSVFMNMPRRYNKSFLGERQSSDGNIALTKGNNVLQLPSDDIKLCANEKCEFHKGTLSNHNKKKCKECATTFCSRECHSLSWKEKQQHYYYCKIISPLYKVLLESIEECPNHRESEYFVHTTTKKIGYIFDSQEYRYNIFNTGSNIDETMRYLSIFSDVLSFYGINFNFTM